VKRLTAEQIKSLHWLLIQETGGLDGIRDENLLDSAINAPLQAISVEYLYKTIEIKAARLGYSLIKNNPFMDGNKRIGILAMLTFLEINGVELNYANEDLIRIGLGIAEGNMYRTLCLKYQCSIGKLKQKYCINGKFAIRYKTKIENKVLFLYNNGFKRQQLPDIRSDVLCGAEYIPVTSQAYCSKGCRVTGQRRADRLRIRNRRKNRGNVSRT
jgi:death on curing protein